MATSWRLTIGTNLVLVAVSNKLIFPLLYAGGEYLGENNVIDTDGHHEFPIH